MRFAKRMLLLAAVGAAIGFLIWSFVGEGAVAMTFGSLGGTVTCKTDVQQALQQFVKWQLYSALAGAVVVPALVALVRRLIGKKRKPGPSEPSAPASE